jgi:hypothetical protein
VARKASLILAVGILLAAGYAVLAARAWPLKAALFPMAIGIPLFCLAAAELVWTFLDKEVPQESTPTPLLPWLWMVGFLALIVLLGFPVAVAVFLLLYLKAQAREGWVFSIVLTAAVWGAFYGLFDAMLHLPFPAGWLAEWLGLAG